MLQQRSRVKNESQHKSPLGRLFVLQQESHGYNASKHVTSFAHVLLEGGRVEIALTKSPAGVTSADVLLSLCSGAVGTAAI